MKNQNEEHKNYAGGNHTSKSYGSKSKGAGSYVPKTSGRKGGEQKSYNKGDRTDRSSYGQKNYASRGGSKYAPRHVSAEDSYDNTFVADVEETGETENAGMVIGRNAVRELLKSGRTVDKLLVQHGQREGSIVVLVAEAVERGIPVVECDKPKMDKMVGFVPHQGVIAMVAEKEYVEVEDILQIARDRGEAPLLVIADGITDPYNLGALIRCAEGCGAHGIIIPKRRATGLTPLVTKASAGAIEHMAIAKVTNLAVTVEKLKEMGVWVFAAEAGGKAYYETDFKGPCALIFGSEGGGVSAILKKTADAVTSIPMYGQVNSFNVSTAASVILAEVARQHYGDIAPRPEPNA